MSPYYGEKEDRQGLKEIEGQKERKKNRGIVRQKKIEAERQKKIKAEKWKDGKRQIDIQLDRQRNSQTYIHTDRQKMNTKRNEKEWELMRRDEEGEVGIMRR